ncbi:MAG: pirin-like C-terminal cupin domain-containing protein, partial [Nitrospinota bacterium]
DGLLWGFQLWVNLPAKDKMCEPRYQNIPPESMAEVECNGGAKVKVIAGTVNGVTGAVKGITANPLYIDVTIKPNGDFSQPITEDHNTFAYVIDGEVSFGGGGETVSPSNLVTFGRGDGVYADAGEAGGRFLLLSGRPLDEDIVRHGPFVMNTEEEIEQAILDYRNGKF